MAIHRLLQHSAFGPEDIDLMVQAFEEGLGILKLTDSATPASEVLAKKIIEVAQTGVRDPKRICRLALEDIGASATK